MSLTLKRWIILLFSLAGLLLTVNQTFLFTRAIGVVMNGQTFLYVLTLVFFPLIFLIVPFRRATTAVSLC